jgi:hypothetical protein
VQGQTSYNAGTEQLFQPKTKDFCPFIGKTDLRILLCPRQLKDTPQRVCPHSGPQSNSRSLSVPTGSRMTEPDRRTLWTENGKSEFGNDAVMTVVGGAKLLSVFGRRGGD